MRWFRRGRSEPPPASDPDPEVLALYDEVGLTAFDRQLRLAELVGDRDWTWDQDRATIRFGSDLELPAQALGSVSHQRGTWLWAWANDSLALGVTERARDARRIGDERGLPLLTEPLLDAGAVGGGHLLALVTIGLLDADAYYRGPYPGGEAYLVLDAPATRTSGTDPEARASMVIRQSLASFGMAPRRPGVVAYLHALGLAVTEDGPSVRVGDGSITAFQFDELGRMTELRTRVPADEVRRSAG